MGVLVFMVELLDTESGKHVFHCEQNRFFKFLLQELSFCLIVIHPWLSSFLSSYAYGYPSNQPWILAWLEIESHLELVTDKLEAVALTLLVPQALVQVDMMGLLAMEFLAVGKWILRWLFVLVVLVVLVLLLFLTSSILRSCPWGLRSSSNNLLLELVPYADSVYSELVSPSIIVWRYETELVTECAVPALAAGASSCHLRQNNLEQCYIVHMIVCILFVDGMHCWAEFTAIIGFGASLKVGQQSDCGMPMTMSYVAISVTFNCISSQLHVHADFLLEIKGMVNPLNQLLQHVICWWLADPVDGHPCNPVEQREIVDTFVVASISCL